MARSGSVPDAAPLQPRLTLPSPAPLPRRSAPPARQQRREQHHSLQDLQSKLTELQRRIDTDFIRCEHLAAGLKRETLNPATTASRELTPAARRVNTASLATTQRILLFFFSALLGVFSCTAASKWRSHLVAEGEPLPARRRVPLPAPAALPGVRPCAAGRG